jgi:periplasmic protein TonB
MSEVIAMHEFGEFNALLQRVLSERVIEEAPRGLEQRLLARLAQEESSRPFAFAERVATRASAASMGVAVGAHAAVILVVFALAARHMQVTAPGRVMMSQVAVPPLRVAPKADSIGGGGGHHDLVPVTQGRLPRLSKQQIVPPEAPPTIAPQLAVEPTVVAQPDLKMAENAMPDIGNPSSSLKGFSMGNGGGTGIGSGDGSGVGPGSGANMGGGVMHVGGSVSKPEVLSSVEPEFSEEARRVKFSGNVEVYLWVDEQGNPSHIRVARGVGMGLDEKAVEAVRQYKFRPAMKNGKPVKVDMYIDVDFDIF